MLNMVLNAIEDRLLVALGIALWAMLKVLDPLLWGLQYAPLLGGVLGWLGHPELQVLDGIWWATPWVAGLWTRPAVIGAVAEAIAAVAADLLVYFGVYRAGANKERLPIGTTHISDAVWGVLAGLYWAYQQIIAHKIAIAILGGGLMAALGLALFLIRRRRP